MHYARIRILFLANVIIFEQNGGRWLELLCPHSLEHQRGDGTKVGYLFNKEKKNGGKNQELLSPARVMINESRIGGIRGKGKREE